MTFATTKERVTSPPKRSDLRADLRALIANGPWLALFFSAIFALMNVAVRNGAIVYYFKYWVGDDGAPIFLIFDATAVFMSTGLFAMVAGVALTATLTRYFEKRRLMIVLTSLNAATMAVFYFLPPYAYVAMLVVNAIGALLAGPTPALVWAMYADCADYGEWKTGRRTTALVFSAVQFAQKLGLAVGAGLSGFILAYFGFVANQPQTPTSLAGIRAMFSLFPAVLALLSALAIVFYRLSDSEVKTIEVELAARRRSA